MLRLARLAPGRRRRIQPQVSQDLLDNRPLEDRRDDPEFAAASVRAVLHVDVEDALEQACPVHSQPCLKPDTRLRLLLAGTRSTRMAAIWQANFERQVCGTETGFT